MEGRFPNRPSSRIIKAGQGNLSGFFLSCLGCAEASTIRAVTQHRTDDLRISGLNPLISPAVLAYYLPLTEHASEVVAGARAQAACWRVN